MCTKSITISTPPFANILLLSYCLYSDEAPEGDKIQSEGSFLNPESNITVEVPIPHESCLAWKFKVVYSHPGISLNRPLCEREITFACNSDEQSVVIHSSNLPEGVFHRFVQPSSN